MSGVRLRRRHICGALVCGLATLLAAPASGWGSAQVTLRPAAGPAGSLVLLSGSGFATSARIRVSTTGMRGHVVRASGRGAFSARMTVRGHGWLRVVSRRGRQRVVNRFHVTRRRPGDGVVEVASSRGPRVRFSPGTVAAGGVLRMHGVGYRPGARLRLSGIGSVVMFAADRRGRFDVRVTMPQTVRADVLRLTLAGGRVHFRVRLRVSRPKPPSPGAHPAPNPVPPAPPPPRPLPPAPSNVSAPTITGTAWSGEVLTAGHGVWRVIGTIEYAYAWQRCDAAGARCAPIAGARGPRYTAGDADVGHRLRITVTASNAGGSAAATSPPTEVVTPTPGVAKAPSVPLTVREGDTISVTPATFTGPAPQTVHFQWQRCLDGTCVAVGSDQLAYSVTTTDVGNSLQVVETATWPTKTIVVASAPTGHVQPAVIATGAIALWHMDDLGATMDDSVGSHDGALHKVVTGQVPAFAGTAFGFNGADSYVTVPVADDLSPVDQDVTLTIRMRTTALPPTTVQDWDLIRSAGGYYDGDEYKMEYAPDGSAHCAFKGNGVTGYKEVASGGGPLNDGNWHTIQCVKTPTRVETIVDGVVYAKSAQIGTITITKGIIVGAHPNTAGAGASEFYQGALDEASLQFG
jgi:hypothetical protein